MTILNDTLRNEKRFWFLKTIYHKLQPPYNKHFACAVASESGGGKSYSTISLACAIYPDFNPNESIAFDALQFLKIANQKKGMGFPMILDDAGLTAFSGDALSKEVGAISKIAQSIRHKNWQVYLNLPSLDLLAKSVRITNHYYLEPVWIDQDTEECFCKFQRMYVNPKGGDKIKFKAPLKYEWEENIITRYNELKRKIYHTVPIPHPPKHIAKEYEKLKNENMEKFRSEVRIELEKRHAAKLNVKPKTNDLIKIVSEHPENFMTNGVIDPAKISRKYDLCTSTAYQIAKYAKVNTGMNA